MKKPYKLPPAQRDPRPLAGPQVEEFSVGSWCPTADGTGEAEAVAISIKITGLGDVVVRMRSPMEVDRVVTDAAEAQARRVAGCGVDEKIPPGICLVG